MSQIKHDYPLKVSYQRRKIFKTNKFKSEYYSIIPLNPLSPPQRRTEHPLVACTDDFGNHFSRLMDAYLYLVEIRWYISGHIT